MVGGCTVEGCTNGRSLSCFYCNAEIYCIRKRGERSPHAEKGVDVYLYDKSKIV